VEIYVKKVKNHWPTILL